MTMISESGAIVEPNEIAGIHFDEISTDVTMEELDALLIPAEDPLEDQTQALEEAMDITVSMQASIEHLQSLYKEVTKAGHISRPEAQMIKNITASVESIQTFFEKTPMKSYTEMGSKVNYTATCEGLISSVLKLIAKMIMGVISTVINLITAVIRALFGIGKKLGEAERADPVVCKLFDKAQADNKANVNVGLEDMTSSRFNLTAPAFNNPQLGKKSVLADAMLANKHLAGTGLSINEAVNIFVAAQPEISEMLGRLQFAWEDLMANRLVKVALYPQPGSKLYDVIYKAFDPVQCPPGKQFHKPNKVEEVLFHGLVNGAAFDDQVSRAFNRASHDRFTVGEMMIVRDFIGKNDASWYKTAVAKCTAIMDKQKSLHDAFRHDAKLLDSGKMNLSNDVAEYAHLVLAEMFRLQYILLYGGKVLNAVAAARVDLSATLWQFSKGYVK